MRSETSFENDILTRGAGSVYEVKLVVAVTSGQITLRVYTK